MKELKFNLKYLLYKKEFYFVILLIFLINILHGFMTVKYWSTFENYYIENMYSAETQFILYNPSITLNSVIIVILPLACSMLFSDVSFIERKNKTFNILYTRINTNKNNFVRFILSLVVPFVICFVGFMLNYLMMSLIFKNGLLMSIYQEPGFYLFMHFNNFMDSLRYSNPTGYVIAISLMVSFIISLLSCLSFSISEFLKQRIPIYFIPLIILVFSEFILSVLKLKNYSLIRFLQPRIAPSFSSFLIASIVIFIIGLLLEFYHRLKKDHIV